MRKKIIKVKEMENNRILILILFAQFIVFNSSCSNDTPLRQTISYTSLSGFVTSPDFKVKANGKEIWTEKVGAGGYDNRLDRDPDKKFVPDHKEDLNIANFSCSGEQRITVKASEAIQNYVIHPKNKNLATNVNGNELTFSIDGPHNLYIEINDLPHLAIFANPLEEKTPTQDTPEVLYFGQGVHDVGNINLQSNQTVYIACGAVVNANVRGANVENIRILGRGCLISVTGYLLVGWAYADGVTSGFELDGGEVKNVFVRDCDIVRYGGGGHTGGHSAFSIVCDGPSKVFNICFKNIRVTSNVDPKNLEIIITDGTLYGKGGIGGINGVYMKDIYWENTEKPFVIQGYNDSHLVENIVFWNCYVGGKLMTKPEDANFQMKYVKDITFIPGGEFQIQK